MHTAWATEWLRPAAGLRAERSVYVVSEPGREAQELVQPSLRPTEIQERWLWRLDIKAVEVGSVYSRHGNTRAWLASTATTANPGRSNFDEVTSLSSCEAPLGGANLRSCWPRIARSRHLELACLWRCDGTALKLQGE